MRKSLQFAVFLKNLATGILAPVLSLALLAHGATVSTVSLMVGAYSFTVIVSEFPSGVFADLCGRKRSFLLSSVLLSLCYCLMLFSRSALALFFAMVLNGLGRAFSSGSIDALAIDEASADDGALVRVTARLSILESAGLASGALLGGMLSSIGDQYAGNIGANLAISAFLVAFTSLCIREQRCGCAEKKEANGERRVSVGAHVKESLAFMMQKGVVRALFVLSLATGFALVSIETYWQIALSACSPAPWVFGAVSFLGFACVILGSKAAERLLIKKPGIGAALLLGFKALAGCCLILLVSQLRELPFIAVYALAYLFIGGGSIAENTLLNRAAPSSRRAGILSLFSFVMQIGGLIASLCGYLVSENADYRSMWLIAGALLLLCAGASALPLKQSRSKSAASR